MTFEWGKRGFELQARGVYVTACLDDVGVKVGPYGLSVIWGRMPITGVFVERPSGNRHWHWDEVRAWFTRRPLASLDAV
ncbi:MAG: hypothetical protein DI590_18865 [Methylorubrum populi]|nr:MAG: hypothetical protein DI590_18865 [Methylorubrum populi]